MFKHYILLTSLFAMSCIVRAAEPETAPATQPATQPVVETAIPEFTFGQPRQQIMAGYTYAYVSEQTSLRKMQETLGVMIPKIEQACESGKLKRMGAYIFDYTGSDGTPDKVFKLEVGIPVAENTAEVDGIKVKKIAPLKCATIVYCGSMAHIPEAFGRIFAGMGPLNLLPTGVTREAYLYWEGMESPNNVTLIQVGAE